MGRRLPVGDRESLLEVSLWLLWLLWLLWPPLWRAPKSNRVEMVVNPSPSLCSSRRCTGPNWSEDEGLDNGEDLWLVTLVPLVIVLIGGLRFFLGGGRVGKGPARTPCKGRSETGRGGEPLVFRDDQWVSSSSSSCCCC